MKETNIEVAIRSAENAIALIELEIEEMEKGSAVFGIIGMRRRREIRYLMKAVNSIHRGVSQLQRSIATGTSDNDTEDIEFTEVIDEQKLIQQQNEQSTIDQGNV